MKGKVRWFDYIRGVGFIRGNDGESYFVHHSEIEMPGFRYLEEGQTVEFSTAKGHKGPIALRVRIAQTPRPFRERIVTKERGEDDASEARYDYRRVLGKW